MHRQVPIATHREWQEQARSTARSTRRAAASGARRPIRPFPLALVVRPISKIVPGNRPRLEATLDTELAGRTRFFKTEEDARITSRTSPTIQLPTARNGAGKFSELRPRNLTICCSRSA